MKRKSRFLNGKWGEWRRLRNERKNGKQIREGRVNIDTEGERKKE
jgi:hypothetical protein